MKYRNTLKKEKLQSLNLVLFFASSRKMGKNVNIIRFSDREFYNNRKSVTGYNYYKPVSKMLNGEFK